VRTEKAVAITEKETAIRIGRALLVEHFPDSPYETMALEAELKNGVWRVRKEIHPDRFGVYFYVELYKNNGRVRRVAMEY
jgi:hypothetical protein